MSAFIEFIVQTRGGGGGGESTEMEGRTMD